MNVYRFTRKESLGDRQLSSVLSHLLFLVDKRNKVSNSDPSDFFEEWEEARKSALREGCESSGIEYVKIFWVPNKDKLTPCFMWTDISDGSTLVVSKFMLYWLENLSDLNEEEGELDEDEI